ncbi:dihydrodipicolinate reductase [Thalassococcus sp. S3]|uniref:dihydrodipicolinate reductase n=1 Tax=Thalassococcus sp. S3 TaxID=2017482 RepID=UPI0010240A54|nr:dihydrodipicolinate reductase [Thalassococcus sp. S3]QBF33749.1 dihydrodipicolinate reductase [Thalassococcus sp. S3]
MRIFAGIAAALFLAVPAKADFAKVANAEDFKKIVSGKTLTRPFVRLQVAPGGAISGTGARWEVTGQWSWQGGYFCRDLYWGGSDLGYNCQEVRVNGQRIRFTSDRGQGDFADFRLR